MIVGSFSINANFEDVFKIPNPPSLSKLFGMMKFVQLDIAALVPFECLFEDGFNYHDRLIFNTVWPLCVGAFMMMFVAVGDLKPKSFPKLVTLRSVIFVIFLTLT